MGLLLWQGFLNDWRTVVLHSYSDRWYTNCELPSASSSALQQPTAYRPRLLLAGAPGSGQSSHLAPALLHHLDKLPVHRLDLPTLYSVSAKTPEESCAQVKRKRIPMHWEGADMYLFNWSCFTVRTKFGDSRQSAGFHNLYFHFFSFRKHCLLDHFPCRYSARPAGACPV